MFIAEEGVSSSCHERCGPVPIQRNRGMSVEQFPKRTLSQFTLGLKPIMPIVPRLTAALFIQFMGAAGNILGL